MMQKQTQTQSFDASEMMKYFVEMVADAVVLKIQPLTQPIQQAPAIERIKLNGIRGIAAFLGCSVSTAQKLKNSGRFPTYNIGLKLFFYSDEIILGLKQKEIN